MSHRFQPLPPEHPPDLPGDRRAGGGDHLYLDDANCAVTHVSGTSGHVNRPANMNHACSSGSAMIHIGWDGTVADVRGAGDPHHRPGTGRCIRPAPAGVSRRSGSIMAPSFVPGSHQSLPANAFVPSLQGIRRAMTGPDQMPPARRWLRSSAGMLFSRACGAMRSRRPGSGPARRRRIIGVARWMDRLTRCRGP